MSTHALGTIIRRWTTSDDEGVWLHREEVLAIAECPKCGQDVECTAETDGWVETRNGSKRWTHDSYGPAMGECCGLVIADWWEGTFAFDPDVQPNGLFVPDEFDESDDDESDFTEEDLVT